MSATILIVDDEEHARQHLSSFLVGKGYEVQAVATLAAAREALQKGVADIVLLDVTLEDGYGPNLLAENSPYGVPPAYHLNHCLW